MDLKDIKIEDPVLGTYAGACDRCCHSVSGRRA